jgi:hypothetical protein
MQLRPTSLPAPSGLILSWLAQNTRHRGNSKMKNMQRLGHKQHSFQGIFKQNYKQRTRSKSGSFSSAALRLSPADALEGGAEAMTRSDAASRRLSDLDRPTGQLLKMGVRGVPKGNGLMRNPESFLRRRVLLWQPASMCSERKASSNLVHTGDSNRSHDTQRQTRAMANLNFALLALVLCYGMFACPQSSLVCAVFSIGLVF